MTMTSPSFGKELPIIELLDEETALHALPDMAEILYYCVEEGSGVGFVLPFEMALAETFWRGRIAGIASGDRHTLVLREHEKIVATVSLELASQPNGLHRAEVSKMLVHPAARRKGYARSLLRAVEDLALGLKRSLLVLDTVTGDRAEKLYPTCGYVKVGVIPDYAALPDGRLEATTVFYKDLTQPVHP